MFQCGFTSPQELIDSIEEGIKNQVAPAYAIKPFFYSYGIESYDVSKQAIEKAILLESCNLEYKKILKALDVEHES